MMKINSFLYSIQFCLNINNLLIESILPDLLINTPLDLQIKSDLPYLLIYNLLDLLIKSDLP